MAEDRYEGIAIIGLSGRFPGASDVEQFWSNLVAGRESISFFTEAELAAAGLDVARLRERGNYVPARGVLEQAECFDAAFFGVNPHEAEVLDPQHRVFLEACWTALEHAGYAPNEIDALVGVYGGASYNTYYERVLSRRPDLKELMGDELVMFGNEPDYLTTRVAYKLGLRGPAVNVSTACSTSLVAVCQAVHALLTYQCDMALAGGVSVKAPQQMGYRFEDGYIGSPDGHTRTFDAKGAGTAFGNGVGVVVLKRLQEAVEAGDQIYAVIKGVGINNDGSQRVSFGAPGVEGQAEAIATAHANAGVDAESISYVEAHGTATPLGDPIEVTALTKAFRYGTDRKQFCALGSVKTNVGHLDAAAGVTGLIKTALSLHHEKLPASLHFERPNPKLDIESSPFYVNAALRPWERSEDNPRRAGVSSFGSGGTNAHVVLEEAPALPSSGPSRRCQMLTISAKTPAALEEASRQLAEYLDQLSGEEGADLEFADAAYTLNTGRSGFLHRRTLAAEDAQSAAAKLRAMDPKSVFTNRQELRDAPVVFLFPGQGAQYVGMGSALYQAEPLFRQEIDRCAEILKPLMDADLRDVMFGLGLSPEEAETKLKQTRYTQPALFTIEYALAKLWMSWGITPSAMIGHSVGEYAAACLAGVFSLEDALMLVAKRAALVQEEAPGEMLSVRLPEHEITPLLNGSLQLAAVNSANLCVVAGSFHAIEKIEKELAARSVPTRKLATSHAFHSAMMQPVLEPFTTLLRGVQMNAPKIPFVSNVNAQWITAEEATSPEYWARHVRDTVRFSDGVAELLKDPRNILLEVGPGTALSSLARSHASKSASQAVFACLSRSGEELRDTLETAGKLWMTGARIDWRGFYASETRHRRAVPTYPFERKRFWPEAQETSIRSSSLATATPAVAVTPVDRSKFETSPIMTAPAPNRHQHLVALLQTLFEELSGYNFADVDVRADLLEFGLDSLLLTQAAQLLQKKFGVAITFRQLMETLSSIDAIATHLEGVLPAGAFAPASPAPPAPVPAASMQSPIPSGTQFAVAAPNRDVLAQILLQQQQLTSQILQLMAQPVDAPAASNSLASSGHATPAAPPTGRLLVVAQEGKSHGPFKAMDRAAEP